MLYRSILRPVLFRLPPESVHEWALRGLSLAFAPGFARGLASRHYESAPFGELRRFGLKFKNPVGLAAGFDKNGLAAQGLAALGFGFVEVGTVTHRAQAGNPRPRLFRLPLDRALVNRLGFNNEGAGTVAAHLARHRPGCVLGINIGKSRVVPIEDAVEDYLASFDVMHPLADYMVVNVSSPNTPNLRELQRADALAGLLKTLQRRNEELSRGPKGRGPVPLLVKIAPDLEVEELESIVSVAESAGLKGIIATNTTTSRAGLSTPSREVESYGEGGLSGAPLRARSTEVVARLYNLTRGRLTIIGTGGIFTADDAWQKICAGASLVQLYTGFIYEGPGVVRRINEGLAVNLRREGFDSLDEAVGCRARELAGGFR
ncbi:MAG TPA: quinone-dependent dihydroorotate dehydrogenase [Pyrinomonadaceae bacterium]|jgi:dihydroorotate dehydrogenase